MYIPRAIARELTENQPAPCEPRCSILLQYDTQPVLNFAWLMPLRPQWAYFAIREP